MANHKSADKRNRQRIIRTIRSRAFRSRVRSAVKAARTAIDTAGGGANVAELVRVAASLLDRAASKNVIPVQQASRLKSRLALHVQRSQQQPAAPSRAAKG
jgi:small subunit ribosomal protein S20